MASPPSRKPFGKETAGTEVAAVLGEQIRGKCILITGVSPNSIGESTALALAGGDPGTLILASRTLSNIQAVARKVRDKNPNVVVHEVIVNLASQVSVREAAERIRDLVPSLDILINNAGISVATRQWSPEGFELTLATNHLGPFLLTNLLMPALTAAAAKNQPGATRIVNLTSTGNYASPFRFSDYNFEGKHLAPDEEPPKDLPKFLYEECDGFPGVMAYCASKTANVLFSLALNGRLHSSGIRSFAVHPGDINTNLDREIGPGFLASKNAAPVSMFKSHDQGCATSLVAALDPSLSEDNSVLYLADCQKGKPAAWASDKLKAAKLWTLSEELTSIAKGNKL